MELEIDSFRPSDAYDAAFLLATQFGDKFKRLTDLDQNELTLLVQEHFFDYYDDSIEQCIVARIAGKTVGLIFLEWGKKERPRSFNERRKRYGFMNALRFRAGMRAMDVREDEDTCYLAKLVVSEEHRGKGIAGKLIDSAYDVASNKGFKRMTLYVSLNNPNASELYRRYGFVDTKVVRSVRERILIGVPGWIYMIKHITPE